MVRRRGERAQSALEAALVLPWMFALIALLVQSAWVIYCGTCVTPAITHAQYSISTQDLSDGADANELIRERMIEASPVLASGTLTVTGASITARTDTYETVQLSDDVFDTYLVATKNELTRRADIQAHVEYEPVNIFALFGNIRFVRDVDASKVIEERFELG